MSEAQLDVGAVAREEPVQGGVDAAAEGALEIGELDDRDLGLRAAAAGRVAEGNLVDLRRGLPAVFRGRRRRRGRGPLHERRVELRGRGAAGEQLVGARELVVDDPLELLVGLRALDVAAVDEEVGRPRHADLAGERQIGVDASLAGVAVQRGVELGEVEPELLRVPIQAGAIQALLVREQLVVHLPELPLRLGRHRRLGGQGGVGVERQRVVAEEDPDLGRVRGGEPFEGGQRPAAEGALEIGELDDRDLRGRRPLRRPAERNPDPVDPVAAGGRLPRGAWRGRRGRRGRRGQWGRWRRCLLGRAIPSAAEHQQQRKNPAWVAAHARRVY